MNNDQHIQAYLNNKLNDEERKEFEQLIEVDKNLKNNFNEYKAIHEAFRLNEAERLKAKLKSHENRKEIRPSSKTLPFFYAIAASVLILIGFGIYSQFFQQDLYNQYFKVYPNVYQPVVRGNSEQSSKAFMYYENRDFVGAQEAFKNILEGQENPNIRFYYALSLLNADQVEPAIKELKTLKTIDFEFTAEVYWYCALAELKLKNFESAKRTLQKLQSIYPKYKVEQLEALLNDF